MSVRETETLKQLESRKSKLKVKFEEEARNKREAEEKAKNSEKQLANLDRQIANLTKSDPVVSEHAVLRYLERTGQIPDIESIKALIMTDALTEQIKTLGNGKYPLGGGLKAVVRDNIVRTVVNKTDKPKRRSNYRRSGVSKNNKLAVEIS